MYRKINVSSKVKGNMDEIESYLLKKQKLMASAILHLTILEISSLFYLHKEKQGI